jgi:hypothetical protein
MSHEESVALMPYDRLMCARGSLSRKDFGDARIGKRLGPLKQDWKVSVSFFSLPPEARMSMDRVRYPT